MGHMRNVRNFGLETCMGQTAYRRRWEDSVKWILEKQDGRKWTGLIWLRMWTWYITVNFRAFLDHWFTTHVRNDHKNIHSHSGIRTRDPVYERSMPASQTRGHQVGKFCGLTLRYENL
jgi:hypothetical protein